MRVFLQVRPLIQSDDKPQPLLDWMCNSRNYAACHALNTISSSIGKLFRLVQGSSQFSPELSDHLEGITSSEQVQPIVGPVKVFITSLERLSSVDVVSGIVEKVAEDTVAYSRDMLRREVGYENITEEGASTALNAIQVRSVLVLLLLSTCMCCDPNSDLILSRLYGHLMAKSLSG